MLREGAATAGTFTVFEVTGAIGVPLGGVPITDAVFITEPASRSAWVTTWTAEHRVVAPGARGAVGQDIPVALGSATVMALMVTLPSFFTAKEYAMVSPTAEKLAVEVALTMLSALV